MDERCRPAQKRYRKSQEGVVFITTSLILTNEIVGRIEKKLENYPEYNSNMSKFIEDNIDFSTIEEKLTNKRRPYNKKGTTTKKTCTFTKDFFDKLKKTGNMSFTVEILLHRILN